MLVRQAVDASNELSIFFRHSGIRHNDVRFPMLQFLKRLPAGIHLQRFGAIQLEHDKQKFRSSGSSSTTRTFIPAKSNCLETSGLLISHGPIQIKLSGAEVV